MGAHLFFLSLYFATITVGSTITNLFDQGLKAKLSPNATIVHNTTEAPRWSDFHAPVPGTVINVATEKDVQATVCIQHCHKRG
jgi:hypothetical protein